MEQLKELYFDPKYGLNSARSFYNKVKKFGYTFDQVDSFIKNTELGQRFKNVKNKDFLPIFCEGGGCYQADITFFPKFIKQNNGIDKILTFINIFENCSLDILTEDLDLDNRGLGYMDGDSFLFLKDIL